MTFAMPIEEKRKSIAWWLQRRGMRTVAIINDGYAEFLDSEFVGEGFDRFVDIDDRPRSRRKDKDVTRVALKELRRLEKEGRPFFLWIHYFGPHDPSSKHADIPSFGKSVAARYEHEVRAWDQAVAPLLKHLDSAGEAQDITVILSADHGEWARKKKRGHGNRLNGDTLRVPMLMKGSGVVPGREESIVSLVDVAATIFALTDTPAPSYLDGTDMRAARESRVLIADTWRYKGGGVPTHDLTAAFDGEYKLVLNQLKQSRTVVKQELFEGKAGKNLDGEVPIPALEAALNAYLEASGSLELHD
jgi:arylsulfatase A-like enzyme